MPYIIEVTVKIFWWKVHQRKHLL